MTAYSAPTIPAAPAAPVPGDTPALSPAGRGAAAPASGTRPQHGWRRRTGTRPMASLVAFFGLAFAGTWLAVAPLVLGPGGFGLLPVGLPDVLSLLIYFGATYAGPTVAAFAAAWLEGGATGVRRFAAGYGRWRVGPRWWLLAPLAFPSLWLFGYSVVLEGTPLLNLARDPMLLATVFLPQVALLFVVALGEEAGWRGFALPRLQAALGPVRATLVLGLLHGLWHLPTFFVAGLLGPFTVGGFATFVLVAVLGTFVYTWVANHTRYSIPIATLVHAGSNASSRLLTELVGSPTPATRASSGSCRRTV